MLDGEQEIIDRAIEGESKAFGLLYDHYLPRIYRFIFIKVGRREEAEDLTHQVFLNSWQNIKGYKTMGFPFSSLLYRMARNEVIDYYRTVKNAIPLDNLVEEPKIELAIEHTLDVKSEMRKVLQAIRLLTPEQQDVVLMRFVDDLSNKEVSKIIGKKEGTVRLIQHRAIQKLKTFLENE